MTLHNEIFVVLGTRVWPRPVFRIQDGRSEGSRWARWSDLRALRTQFHCSIEPDWKPLLPALGLTSIPGAYIHKGRGCSQNRAVRTERVLSEFSTRIIHFVLKVASWHFFFFLSFFVSNGWQRRQSSLPLRWTLLCLHCPCQRKKTVRDAVGGEQFLGHLSLCPSYFGHSFQSQGTNTRWVPWSIP